MLIKVVTHDNNDFYAKVVGLRSKWLVMNRYSLQGLEEEIVK